MTCRKGFVTLLGFGLGGGGRRWQGTIPSRSDADPVLGTCCKQLTAPPQRLPHASLCELLERGTVETYFECATDVSIKKQRCRCNCFEHICLPTFLRSLFLTEQRLAGRALAVQFPAQLHGFTFPFLLKVSSVLRSCSAEDFFIV